MKILFTSVGRRVELMQCFRAAADKNNIQLDIYGADLTDTAPALFYCDKTFTVPRINSDSYIPKLLAICEEEKIDALIPTIDTDLLVLSQNKDEFLKLGTKVLVSDADKIAICRDKRLTSSFFESVGLDTPKTYDDVLKYDGGFPAFIKPKDGSSSVNAYKVNDANELKAYSEHVPDYIIQPFVSGTEYTVDILCDTEGNPVYITPRIRLAVRAGEVLKTEISNNPEIISEMLKLIDAFKPCGAITVQLIRDEKNNRNSYIEINPRFGGGAPLSVKAGADSCEAILRLLGGEKLSYIPCAACDGAVFCRFDQSIRIN